MISKELLSEVLGTKTIQMNPILENNNMVGYLVYGSQDTITQIRSNHKQINIYELAHKCKEWAYRQGYVLLSGYSAYGVGLFFCSCKGWLSENYDKQIEITHNTESEAIFKACQWILDNKENK